MSEYQYYEFQAIDRPLTREQMDELRSYSTRARITRTSFVNDYSWGDLKGDPDAWMEKYFDAFFYYANWGTHVLKLRLSSRLLDLKTAQEYCAGESAAAWGSRGNVILSFDSEDEEGGDWVEEEDLLSSLIPVRAELAHGDLRALYLGWLLCAQNNELDDEDIEPAVPPGLGQLDASLTSFAEFLRIDGDLLDVAAEASAAIGDTHLSPDEARAWVAGLPAKEKDDMLAKLIADENLTLVTELGRRFHSTRAGAGPKPSAARRTVGELLQTAEARAEERRQAEARKRKEEAERRQREAAIARAKYLDSLAARQPQLWARVENLIAETKPKSYEQAIKLLVDLRDLAQREERDRDFRMGLDAIHVAHARKPAFIDRLRKAGL
jgi:hypothetical protein